MELLQRINRKAQKLVFEGAVKFSHFINWHNVYADIYSEYPEIFNRYGEKLKIYYLADREYSHEPYGLDSRVTKTKVFVPGYILWDRYNYGLKTHFYSHYEAFRTMGSPEHRFAVLNESKAMLPDSYRKYIRNKKYFENEFDLVFTFDEEILNTISNARHVPFSANYWYGENDESAISPENYKTKTKDISIIASEKNYSKPQVIRQKIAKKCLDNSLADTYGKFTIGGGVYAPIELPFKDYRYSIVVENDITAYYFTEKILRACTPQEYERRLEAILDNYNRVKKYKNPSDYLYTEYLRGCYD